jgi:uncharacterized protein (DUF2147 family)
MKKLALVAALLLATTSAHAGNSISFEVNGHRIRIEAPRNCDSLSCLQISGSGLSGSGFGSKSKRFDDSNYDDDNNVTANSDQPATKSQSAPVAQAAAPAAQAPAQVAPAPAPVVAPVATNAATTAAPVNAPAAPAVVASNSPAPAVKNDIAPAVAPAVAPAATTTPVGIWSTEENKGRVRVEPCGENLCGYAVNSGEKILINMKPSDSKWTGRIHDPDSGRNYDSTITMKGPNALRVQGCAFGGLFCGGQTWSRVS